MAGRANKSCKSQDRWARMPRYTTKMGHSVCRMDCTQGHQGQRLQARENIQAHIETSRNLMLGGRIMRACPTKTCTWVIRKQTWAAWSNVAGTCVHGQTVAPRSFPKPYLCLPSDARRLSYRHSRSYVFAQRCPQAQLQALPMLSNAWQTRAPGSNAAGP